MAAHLVLANCWLDQTCIIRIKLNKGNYARLLRCTVYLDNFLDLLVEGYRAHGRLNFKPKA